MMPPLFQFQLRPLHQVDPWHDGQLHWWGLSEGWYWIQAGQHRLFEYSPSAASSSPELSCCDYQVARFYEDVLTLAPYALEVVPEALQPSIMLNPSTETISHGAKWSPAVPDDASDDDIDQLVLAQSWISNRVLDCSYLSPGMRVTMWSDANDVHLQWDHRDKLINGIPAWSAVYGRWRVSRSDFELAVLDFHARFMAQMAERINQLEAPGVSGHAALDVSSLWQEQQTRSQCIRRHIAAPSKPTDWSAFMAATAHCAASHG